MNTDRFLTRVFDKHEKKMIYEGDIKQNFSFDTIIHGINSAGIIREIVPNLNDNYDEAEIGIIPFGDRFIPMQCQGQRDKNKKLFYEADIVIDGEYKAIVTCDEYDNVLFLYPFNKEDYGHFHESIFEDCIILGNKWENPEYEEKQINE